MMRRALYLTPLAVIALAGCGGDDSDPTTAAAAEAIPSEEWIKQADVICQQTDEQVQGIGQPQNLKDVARVAGEIQGVVAGELEQLRALAPPADIGEQVTEMLDLEELEVKSFDAIAAAASTGDDEQFQSVFDTASKPGNESNRIAQSLGMEECEEPIG